MKRDYFEVDNFSIKGASKAQKFDSWAPVLSSPQPLRFVLQSALTSPVELKSTGRYHGRFRP